MQKLSLLTLLISIFLFIGCQKGIAQNNVKSLNIQYAVREGAATNLTSLDIYAPKTAKVTCNDYDSRRRLAKWRQIKSRIY